MRGCNNANGQFGIMFGCFDNILIINGIAARGTIPTRVIIKGNLDCVVGGYWKR